MKNGKIKHGFKAYNTLLLAELFSQWSLLKLFTKGIVKKHENYFEDRCKIFVPFRKNKNSFSTHTILQTDQSKPQPLLTCLKR